MHPPLYAWLEAVALALSGDRAPIATVVPSFLAGVVLVLLVYRLGVLWGGPAVGGFAAVLTGLNRLLLNHMQFANPATLGLAFALAALLADSRAVRLARQGKQRCWLWTAAAGVALGLSLLSVAFFGLLVPVILSLQRLLLGGEPLPPILRLRWPWYRRLAWQLRDGFATLLAIGIGLAVAAPWHLLMAQRHGSLFWRALFHPPFSGMGNTGGPIEKLIGLAPATLSLSVYGVILAIRRLQSTERGSTEPRAVGTALVLAWISVTLFLPLVLPAGPRPVLFLFLMVPLNLLAGHLMFDLALRREKYQVLSVVVPFTLVFLVWWASPPLRNLSGELIAGRVTTAVLLAPLLGLILLMLLRQCALLADRWAAGHDVRQRFLIGSFLALVLGVTLIAGIHEVEYRHRETLDLLSLRQAILHREATQRFARVTILDPGSLRSQFAIPWPPVAPLTASYLPGGAPGGRLRFVLRSALPGVTEVDTGQVEELTTSNEGPQLVVLVGAGNRLSYSAQARLRLESIFPSRGGILDAYATSLDRPHFPVSRHR